MPHYGTATTIIDDFDLMFGVNPSRLGKILVVETIYDGDYHFGESRYFDKWEDAEKFIQQIREKEKKLNPKNI